METKTKETAILMFTPSMLTYNTAPRVWRGKKETPSLKGSSRRVHNNVPKGVCNIAATSMLNKLRRREEVSMAHTHDPHFLPLTIFVQNTLNSSSIRTIPFCKYTRHVFHLVCPNVSSHCFLGRMVFPRWILPLISFGSSCHILIRLSPWTRRILAALFLRWYITNRAFCFTTATWSCCVEQIT